MARKTQQIPVLVTPDMKQRLQEAAQQRGVSMAVVVRWALEAYFILPMHSENGNNPTTETRPTTEAAPLDQSETA